MSNSGQNLWIVLLNKNPKGPLTADEIRALMNQGILRANDVAYLVNEGDLKARSEWKLLWQFPEFNRRKTAPEPAPDTSVPKERRNLKAPEEIKKQALEDLPAELIHISPEDLLPKSTSIQFNSEPTKMSYSVEDLELNLNERPDGKAFSSRSLYIGASLVLALVVTSSFFFKKTTLAPILSKKVEPLVNRGVAVETNYERPSPPVRNREYVPPNASIPKAPPPQPMDTGPVPVREIQRSTDVVEIPAEARDEEEQPQPKKPIIVKSGTKRKVTSDEEEEEVEAAKNDEDETEE